MRELPERPGRSGDAEGECASGRRTRPHAVAVIWSRELQYRQEINIQTVAVPVGESASKVL
ncbi:hypothetical protein [Haladaptatus pallidirubidus]|uniref:hypothetical protein n=1 Tax=Haladaptatus pallidirubidus TaxID=1008152 RepID=UPI0036F2C755